MMKKLSHAAAAGLSLLIGGALMTGDNPSALAAGRDELSAATQQELARARSASVKYHNVGRAEAEGYVNIDFCEPAEGCHWLKPSLVDCVFDPEQPEILLYAPGDNGLRLVAVEYVTPLTCSLPAGFTGDADAWREDTEGAGLWELTVWLWLHNPSGLFEQHNPKVP